MVPHDYRCGTYCLIFRLYHSLYLYKSGARLGGALMFVSMLISIGVFYIGWDTGRNRPEEQEPEDQETSDAEHRQEL